MTRLTALRVLAGLAILAQVALLFRFLVMGLGWGGFWYGANLVQATVILVVGGVLLWRRPLLVLPLPVLSLLLMLAFSALDPSLKNSACTEVEQSAIAELSPPPGTPPLDFVSEPANGCIARYTSDLSAERLLDHYRQTGERAGWAIREPGEVVSEPGEQASESTGSLDLDKESVTAGISYERAGDEGPARDQLWVVVTVYERTG